MVAPPPLERLSVADAVQRYLRGVQRAVRGHSLAATTAANYERDLAEFVDLVGADRILDDLTGEDVDDVVLAYADKPDGRYSRAAQAQVRGEPKRRGPGAQARFRQSVSRLFTEAAAEGWVQASPMPRTKVKPRARGLTNAARKALPQSSAAALVTGANPSPAPGARPARVDMHLGLRDAFLLRLLMEVGPRVSEVSRADRADLDRRDDGTVWLRLYGKGAKERWVPLSTATVAAYDRYLAEERPQARPRTRDVADAVTGETSTVEVDPADDAERALLLTWRGLRMKPRDVQLLVQRASARLPADLRRAVTPHGLRHTAATLLLTSGAADIKTVQALLGHESIATTGVYLDTVDAAMVQAVAQHPVTAQEARRPGG